MLYQKRQTILTKIAVFMLLFSFAASPVLAFKQDYTPIDPDLTRQGYLNLINIGPSWSDEIKGNKQVVVAVLDSGVDLHHPDLLDNIWTNGGEIPNDGVDNDKNSYIDDVYGWNFVSSNNDPEPVVSGYYDYVAINHGTIVAGIIAAQANQEGIVGIAPQVKIMPLKILDEKGSGNILTLSQAINYAVDNGADIINLSLVGDSFNKTLSDAIINAYNKGVVIVAASGNESAEGINLDESPRYPVCEIDDQVNRVLGVAAVDNSLVMSKFSNYGGQCIDISAPGNGFYSTTYHSDDNVDFNAYYGGGWSGTSVSAPTVSATAALIKMQYPELKPYDIYTILKATAKDLSKQNPFQQNALGSGLLDVGMALNRAKEYFEKSAQIVLAPTSGLAPEIYILDKDGKISKTWLAYSAGFKGGVNVATGDVTGDGNLDIVTSPMTGGGPHIRVFSDSGEMQSEFFAEDKKFNSGLSIALGQLDEEPGEEIVTAPLARTAPYISIFDYQGKKLNSFLAYDAKYLGGVNVAIGDVNNDGQNEIVTAPRSGGSEIRVFDFNGRLISKFKAYSYATPSGVNLSVADINNDAWPDIVTVPARGAADLKVYSLRGKVKSSFMPYSKYLTSGIKIVAADISGDGLPEIITLPNQGSTSLLRVFDDKGVEKSSLFLRHPQDKHGYNFAILSR